MLPNDLKDRMDWTFCESIRCPYFQRMIQVGGGIQSFETPMQSEVRASQIFSSTCTQNCLAWKYHDYARSTTQAVIPGVPLKPGR